MSGALLRLLRAGPSGGCATDAFLPEERAELEQLRADGLIQQHALRDGDTIWHPPIGRLLTLLELPDGSLAGIDEDDPALSAVRFSEDRLVCWVLDVGGFCRRLADVNHLTGGGGPVGTHVFCTGYQEVPSRKLAYCVALVESEEEARRHLPGVPALAGAAYDLYVCLTPGYQPSPETRVFLEGLRLRVMPLSPVDPFVLPSMPLSSGTSTSFSHSPDYRSVGLAGVRYPLTPAQAEVVKVLHEAHQEGLAGLSFAQIQLRLSSGSATRMAEIFKGSAAWKTFITWDKRGVYRLAL